jgi:ribosome-associated protein
MRRRTLPGKPPPTKGELKRRAQTVQELADRLIEAPEPLVAGLGLPEEIADAVALARRITRHGARLRQRQFVGKLLRKTDPEPIRAALDAQAQATRLAAARFRRAERWRDRLVQEGDAAIAEFLAACPSAAAAELTPLVAAAAAERAIGRGGAGRKLFRWVEQHL